MAVMATVAKGYDLDYAWRAVGEAYLGAGYYLAASEAGEPLGTWWGPGAERLGFTAGQMGRSLGGHRRTPGRPRRSTRACWPPSLMRMIIGGRCCGSRRSGRPGSRRCISI